MSTYLNEKNNRDLSQIPGTYGYPVIGHTFDFLNDPLASTLRDYQKYGPVFRQSLAFQRMVATVGPDMVKLLTVDADKLFSSRMGWEGLTGEYFSGSQSTANARQMAQTCSAIFVMRKTRTVTTLAIRKLRII